MEHPTHVERAWSGYAPVESFDNLSAVNYEFTIQIAAQGDLELLKWAVAKGCEWDDRVCRQLGRDIWRCCSGRELTDVRGTLICSAAALGGHLEVL